ncbi:MAG: hypothetical protein Q4G58_09715 [bacterium]|nr:hypothetical protein [bacterium]
MSLKLKKTISMFLAAAALTTVVAPTSAFAADPTAAPVKGEVSAPVISVKVPTFSSGSFTMDPYNQLLTGEQIISSEFTFENDSTVDMEVQLTGYNCTVDKTQATSITPQLITSYTDLSDDTANKILLALVAKTKDEDTLVDGDWSNLEDGEQTQILEETSSEKTGLTKSLGIMARGSYASRNAADGSIKANDRKLTDGSDKLVIKFDGAFSGAAEKGWEKVGISVVPTFKYIPQVVEAGVTDLSGVQADSATPDAPSGTLSATSKFSGVVKGLPSGVTLKTTLTADDYELIVEGAEKTTAPKFTVKNNTDGTANIDLAGVCSSTTGYASVTKVKLTLKESAFVIAEGNFKDTDGYNSVVFTWTK